MDYYDTLITTLSDDDLSSMDAYPSTAPPTAAVQSARVLRLYDIFIPMLGVFIILLNLMVVVSSGLILKRGQQPRSTYLFLGNVALTDLLTGIAVLFGQFYPSEQRDELSCAIQLGMIVSATLTSAYSVVLIAVDRFLYILHGLQYQRWLYSNRARLLIVITWIIGIVIGFLPAFGWRGDSDNGRRCWFIIVAPPALVMVTSFVGFLPIVVVIVLYSIILHRTLRRVIQLNNAHKNHVTGAVSGNLRMHVGNSSTLPVVTSNSSKSGGVAAAAAELNNNSCTTANNHHLSDTEEPLQPKKKSFFTFLSRSPRTAVAMDMGTANLTAGTVHQAAAPPNRTAKKSLSKWKAIKVVLFTSGSFVITWVPYFIACVMYVACDPDATPQRCTNLQLAIASPLAILGFANSLLNPVIYAWWHNGFRASAKAIFCRCRRKCKTDESRGSGATGSSSGGGGASGAGHNGTAPTTGGATGRDTAASSAGIIRRDVSVQQRHSTVSDDNNGSGSALGIQSSVVSLNVSTTDLDLSDDESDVESGTVRDRRKVTAHHRSVAGANEMVSYQPGHGH